MIDNVELVKDATAAYRDALAEGRVDRIYEGRFAGKVAVIVGGAQGSGRAAAMRLAAEGASLALLDIAQEPLDELAQRLPGALYRRMDATNSGDVAAVMPEVVAALGGIDILIHVAGGGVEPAAPFWEQSEAEWHRIINQNLTSQWLTVKTIVPLMKERGKGKIVTYSSGAAFGHASGLAAYAAAKAGVNALVVAMARDLGPFNINVNAIAPGSIWVEHMKPVYQNSQEIMDTSHAAGIGNQALSNSASPQTSPALCCF